MTIRVAAYQHGIYPRSEDVVAATRGLERGRVTPDEVAEQFAKARDDFVDTQREAGLDYFSDGLLRWQDIFRPLVGVSGGLAARTLVRWFDNNSFFRAPEVTGDLTVTAGVPTEFADGNALPLPKVATLPSPYMFSRALQSQEDRNPLMMDLTREVLRPVVQGLVARGYELIHLQEPWLVYFGMEAGDWDDFAKAVSELRDVAGDGTALVLHTYFGDAGPYADRLRALPVDAVGVDFVQTDIEELGSGWETGILAGCLDGRSSPVESLEGTVEFARHVAEATGAPALYLSSNCDLEFLPSDVARQKVLRLGEIAGRVKETVV
jgi:5-methyltetrahydropteroyltriglutamate--homocysteine methyltransferase